MVDISTCMVKMAQLMSLNDLVRAAKFDYL